MVWAVARVDERMVVRTSRPSQEGSTNLTINLTAVMPTHLIDTIFNKLREDFHDKEQERTKMKRHEELETTVRTRSMEKLSSSSCLFIFVLFSFLSWKSSP